MYFDAGIDATQATAVHLNCKPAVARLMEWLSNVNYLEVQTGADLKYV
jgi:hypothetical protein